MTVKLAILKSGENVIADIKELVSEDEKVVSYVFTYPFLVEITEPEILTDDETETLDKKYGLSVYRWMPLTNQKDIVISPDWIVSIVEPISILKKSYEEKNYGRGNEESSDSSFDTSEQLESDN